MFPSHLELDELLVRRGEDCLMPEVCRGVAQTRGPHSCSSSAGRKVEGVGPAEFRGDSSSRSSSSRWRWRRRRRKAWAEGSEWLEEMLVARNLSKLPRLLHHREAGGVEGEDLRLRLRGRSGLGTSQDGDLRQSWRGGREELQGEEAERRRRRRRRGQTEPRTETLLAPPLQDLGHQQSLPPESNLPRLVEHAESFFLLEGDLGSPLHHRNGGDLTEGGEEGPEVLHAGVASHQQAGGDLTARGLYRLQIWKHFSLALS